MRTSGRLAVVLQSIVVSTLSGCGGTTEGGQLAAVSGGGADHGSAGGSSGGQNSAGGRAGGSGGDAQTGGFGVGGIGGAAGAIGTGTAGEGRTGASGAGSGGAGVAGQGAGGSFGHQSMPIAHLEQAAVLAFEVIERELERFDAPQDLRDRAKRARADEVRHASRMTEVAQRWEARVPCANAAPCGDRSLLAAALENAVEGCVREAWGALSAHYQAAATCDPEAQRMWREIAVDESEHAELSLALHEWYLTQLAEDERAQVHLAMERARLQLRVELADAAPPHVAVVHGAGVPDPICAVALFGQLESQVLAA